MPTFLSDAAPIIPPHGLFEHYAPRIAALPASRTLTRDDLLVPDFLLHHEAAMDIYYAPFDYVNEHARIVLVGIAPGWYQTELAFRTARNALLSGADAAEVSALARQTASFSGPIRKTLVAMLDGLGLHDALGIATCAELYGARHDLLHSTAVVRYPVFVQGQNFTGYKPDIAKTPLLRRFATEALAAELRLTARALVLPLGKSIRDALRMLVTEGLLEGERLLPGLPHPSGANVHRPRQYAQMQPENAARIKEWFGR
jgi:hypothetical protein